MNLVENALPTLWRLVECRIFFLKLLMPWKYIDRRVLSINFDYNSVTIYSRKILPEKR